MRPVVGFRLKPAGSVALPVASDQVYGAVPPAAVRRNAKGSATSPLAAVPEEIASLLTVKVRA
jgi:hypothetical protein